MISVCMATYNGEKYIKEQIDSILPQLGEEDELVISDDGSTDRTVEIIESYKDSRLRLYMNKLDHGVTHNFENALLRSSGNIVFLADQDDVWLPNKIKALSVFLIRNDYDIVTCDCALTDPDLNVFLSSYYANKSPLDKSVWGNFVKNFWLGSCMAFKRSALDAMLPFPKHVAAHDLWIALFGQMHYKCGYYPKVLQYYRRHDSVVSFAGTKSRNKLSYKISYRVYLAYYLVIRSIKRIIL